MIKIRDIAAAEGSKTTYTVHAPLKIVKN